MDPSKSSPFDEQTLNVILAGGVVTVSVLRNMINTLYDYPDILPTAIRNKLKKAVYLLVYGKERVKTGTSPGKLVSQGKIPDEQDARKLDYKALLWRLEDVDGQKEIRPFDQEQKSTKLTSRNLSDIRKKISNNPEFIQKIGGGAGAGSGKQPDKQPEINNREAARTAADRAVIEEFGEPVAEMDFPESEQLEQEILNPQNVVDYEDLMTRKTVTEQQQRIEEEKYRRTQRGITEEDLEKEIQYKRPDHTFVSGQADVRGGGLGRTAPSPEDPDDPFDGADELNVSEPDKKRREEEEKAVAKELEQKIEQKITEKTEEEEKVGSAEEKKEKKEKEKEKKEKEKKEKDITDEEKKEYEVEAVGEGLSLLRALKRLPSNNVGPDDFETEEQSKQDKDEQILRRENLKNGIYYDLDSKLSQQAFHNERMRLNTKMIERETLDELASALRKQQEYKSLTGGRKVRIKDDGAYKSDLFEVKIGGEIGKDYGFTRQNFHLVDFYKPFQEDRTSGVPWVF